MPDWGPTPMLGCRQEKTGGPLTIRSMCLFMVSFLSVLGQSSPLDSTSTAPDSSVLLTSPPPPAVTLAPGQPAETTDSLALATSKSRRSLADSLNNRSARIGMLFLNSPLPHDSLGNPLTIQPYELFASDAIGVSEVLVNNPYFTRIPITLTNHYNRYLFRGYPAPWTESSPATAGDRAGSDSRCITELDGISVDPTSGPTLLLQPLDLVKPFASLFWENGLLKESTVRVLFGRPLSRSLDLVVFSNFRSFSGEKYDHTRGGIYSFYHDLSRHPDLVMRGGYHPLIHEHSAGIRTTWQAPNGSLGSAAYRYLDFKNNYAYEKNNDTIFLDTTYQWSHHFTITSPQLKTGLFNTHLDLSASRGSIRTLQAADTRGLLADTIAGREAILDGTLETALSLTGDRQTGIRIEPGLQRKRLSDHTVWNFRSAKVSVFYTTERSLGRINMTGDLNIGHAIHWVNGQLGNLWTGSASLRAARSHSWAQLHATRVGLPYNPPFDTAVMHTGTVYDAAGEVGLDVYAGGSRGGVLTACTYRNGIDTSTLVHAWPYGVPPYQQPRLTFMVAPSIGPVGGFNLMVRYLLSDSRPYHKILGRISYSVNTSMGKETVRFDLLADYWSKRDKIEFGGIDTWNREILNVQLKTSVQVRSFRLFYKIDNLLNREIAYVPGNRMTGLTFRWGFSWILQR